MNDKEYIEKRLDNQIKWYSQTSQKNQKYFKRLKFGEILCAALIPFLVGYADTSSIIQIIVGLLGIFIAVVTGVIGLHKFQENWIEYRTTAETLKHQKYLYETSCTPYDDENSFKKLVQICEGIISKENSNWSQYVKISDINEKKSKL